MLFLLQCKDLPASSLVSAELSIYSSLQIIRIFYHQTVWRPASRLTSVTNWEQRRTRTKCSASSPGSTHCLYAHTSEAPFESTKHNSYRESRTISKLYMRSLRWTVLLYLLYLFFVTLVCPTIHDKIAFFRICLILVLDTSIKCENYSKLQTPSPLQIPYTKWSSPLNREMFVLLIDDGMS